MPTASLTDGEVEEQILASADALFYLRGIANVSMAEIRDASGVSMRRLYGFSASKSDLVARWLEYRHAMWTEGFIRGVEHHVKANMPVVEALFAALADWMTATDFRGCGFINTHAESAELSEEHRSIIRRHKAELTDYLETLTGHGNSLAVLIDGAIVQASIFATTEPIRLAQRAAQLTIKDNS